MAKAVGVDLRTNSVTAVQEGGEPSAVPNAEGARTTPPAVAFSDDGQPLVGQLAARQPILNPKGTVTSAKRFVGRRYEISEEAKAVSFSRLVGAPPGYVGPEEGGSRCWTTAGSPTPTPRDVPSTSALGSQHLLQDATRPGEIEPEARALVMSELNGRLRPEFLRRVDGIVLFHPLGIARVERIVDLLLDEPHDRLAEQRVTLVLTEPARHLIAAGGYDPVYGARPLRRFIAHEVETRSTSPEGRADRGGRDGTADGAETSVRTVACPNRGRTNRVPAAAEGSPRRGNRRAPVPWIAEAGDADFGEAAEQGSLPVPVDLRATWCGPCRMVSPALEQVAKDLAGRIKSSRSTSTSPHSSHGGSRSKPYPLRWFSTTAGKSAARPAPRPRTRCASGWTESLSTSHGPADPASRRP